MWHIFQVPSHQVAQLEGNYFKEEMMMMKLAETASKQYAELERITVSLNKAFTPPPEKQSKSKNLNQYICCNG